LTTQPGTRSSSSSPRPDRPGLPAVLREWGRIGCIGFGGPPTHIALLRELCVERRRWVGARDFEDAVAACNLLPGPASTQLAIYCAWRVGGRPAAIAGGAAFIVPGLVLILALAVLFLCTGNSARSQMAEALAEQLGGGGVRAFSAGSDPKPLHPDAVRVMHGYGIDLRGRRSKHLAEFALERFDSVVTLCDRVREVCPEFPGDPEAIHWSIPDPSRAAEPDAFERTASELAARIPYLFDLIEEAT